MPTPHTFGHLSNLGSQLSADGAYLLRVQRNAGRMSVIVSRADGSEPVTVVKPEENLVIYFALWARDTNRAVISAGGRGSGVEMLYAVDMAPGPGADGRLDLLKQLRAPEALYVSAGPRDNLAFPVAIYRDAERSRNQSLFQLDLARGRLVPVEQEGDIIPFVFGACPTQQFGLRFDAAGGTGPVAQGAVSYFVRRQGTWKLLHRIDETARAAGSALASCSEERGEIYLLDAEARDFVSLATYDLTTLERKSVSANRGDITSILFDRQRGIPLFFTADFDKPETTVLDTAQSALTGQLDPLFDHGFELLSRSADGQAMLVAGARKGRPDAVHLWRGGTLVQLYWARDDLGAWQVQPQQPQLIRARDGLVMPGYVTMPLGACAASGCKTVLLVHGGPGERDSIHADPVVQWLAAQGYMVLTVNYRGSHGAGRDLENRGRREWGGKMQDDLDDAARWAAEYSLADPSRIAIMGSSYGGFAALEAVLRAGHPFACAVSMSGTTDLADFVRQRVRAAPEMEDELLAQIGDPGNAAQEALLRERSPAGSAAKLAVPLLMSGVEHDPIVPLAGALQFERLEEKLGKSAMLSLFAYPGVGHVFNNPANERVNWLLVQRFLGKCLDGREMPSDDELNAAIFAVRRDGLHLLP